jgi:hypothetical protein
MLHEYHYSFPSFPQHPEVMYGMNEMQTYHESHSVTKTKSYLNAPEVNTNDEGSGGIHQHKHCHEKRGYRIRTTEIPHCAISEQWMEQVESQPWKQLRSQLPPNRIKKSLITKEHMSSE